MRDRTRRSCADAPVSSRWRFSALVLCSSVALVPVGGCGENPRAARKLDEPINVVLLSMDTTRRDHVSFYGYEQDTTPALKRLVADRGVVFDSAFAVHTNTAPSHGSMLTGLYPKSHGIRHNGMRLDDQVVPLAELLDENGYATGGFVSSWTLTEHTGLDRGFEVYDAGLPDGVSREAEMTLEKAQPWVRSWVAAGEPFFLFLHLFDPHFPYHPPEDDGLRFLPRGTSAFSSRLESSLTRLKARTEITPKIGKEYIARYDGEIAYADRQLGRLLELLEELGVAERTLVVFLSDHGETLYERGWIFDHGGRVYDEQIGIPMALRLPGDAHADRRVGAPVSHVDVLPTILDVLDLPPPGRVAGRSLLPLIDGSPQQPAPRPVYAHARVRPERVPEIEVPLDEDRLVSTIRLPTVKLIEYPLTDGGWHRQLFDLVEDPGEHRNVAKQRAGVADELHDQLSRWREATGGSASPPPTLSDDAERKLRALGYVQ